MYHNHFSSFTWVLCFKEIFWLMFWRMAQSFICQFILKKTVPRFEPNKNLILWKPSALQHLMNPFTYYVELSYHSRSKNLLARRVVNALTCVVLGVLGIEGILKRAVRGSGSTVLPRTSLSVSNMAVQNSLLFTLSVKTCTAADCA